jgi:Na+-transporting NADH:ubiquinone oxidoreductase subunit NqrB
MVNTSTPTASLSQPKPSAAGWASLTALAILANPRGISKTIVLDAQVFLGPTDSDLLIGSLRYFNSNDHTFDDEPHLYSITATVSSCCLFPQQPSNFQFARRESMADVPVSGNRALFDYTFIGDILTVSGNSARFNLFRYNFLLVYSTRSSWTALSGS